MSFFNLKQTNGKETEKNYNKININNNIYLHMYLNLCID